MSNVFTVTATLEQGLRQGAESGRDIDRPTELTPTEERIVSAALRLIGRRGVKRLGMQEISEAAGVSRGTLYRYFPSKDHVLAAASAYDESNFSNGLATALAGVTDPADQLRTYVAFSFEYIRNHPARYLFESEPEFVMGYLLDRLPSLRESVLEELGDSLDTVPAVASGQMTRGQVTDLIVRLFASSWIIAETDEGSLVDSINNLLLPT